MRLKLKHLAVITLWASPCSLLAQAPAVTSRAEALSVYPDLKVPNSEFNKRFLVDFQRAQAAKDPILLDGNWPMVIAKRVAAELDPPGPPPVATKFPFPLPPAGAATPAPPPEKTNTPPPAPPRKGRGRRSGGADTVSVGGVQGDDKPTPTPAPAQQYTVAGVVTEAMGNGYIVRCDLVEPSEGFEYAKGTQLIFLDHADLRWQGKIFQATVVPRGRSKCWYQVLQIDRASGKRSDYARGFTGLPVYCSPEYLAANPPET